MTLFDKNIHRDEFRLRILMTDGCNKSCSFCLNDFQPKPKGKPKFICHSDAWSAITTYCALMQMNKRQPVVTFSGGEPGIHPSIHDILATARRHGAFVKVVTNGTALYLSELRNFVDCWHVSVTGKSQEIIDFLKYNPGYNVQIQHVVNHGEYPWRLYAAEALYDLVRFYGAHELPIKLWVNFFDSPGRQETSRKLIEHTAALFPKFEIKSRFTGKQENRGEACSDCRKDCVTLKALWVFPDGTASTCPQGIKERRKPISWWKTMERAYKLHMN